MKILLSAYACEPGKGSEPGVGWRWALELARMGHQVWVITRENNRPAIEKELPSLETDRPVFIYCDLPSWMQKIKKKGPFIQAYYGLWQYRAWLKARAIHQRENFDLAHHITFGVFRQPSFMGLLGIPFIFGPLGGGERVPLALRFRYGLRGQVADFLRDILNGLSRLDPCLHLAYRKASVILVKTPQTFSAIPARYHHKTRQAIEIGIEPPATPLLPAPSVRGAGFKILYVGRFLYWKGMAYGFEAFRNLLADFPEATLTMVGNGPDEVLWKAQCQALGIGHRVEWLGWVDRARLMELYAGHDLFLFPSLHDSSGNVILEAMSHGLPVVSFDLGGPGVLVNESAGRKVPVSESPAAATENLTRALKELAENPGLLRRLRQGALQRAAELGWKEAVRGVYDDSDMRALIFGKD